MAAGKLSLETILFSLAAILAILVVINTGLIVYSTSTLDSRIAAIREEARPARLELTTLIPYGCPQCASLDYEISQLEAGHVNITKRTTVYPGAPEAAGLPAVSRLPAVFIKGETNKSAALASLLASLGFVQSGSYIVLEASAAPYYEVSTSSVRGIVNATAISAPASCARCTNASLILDGLAQGGVYLSSRQTVTSDSPLVASYLIGSLPAVVLSGDLPAYPELMSQQVMRRVTDSLYIFEPRMPIYYNISAGKPEGEFNITYLNDSACLSCHDVLVNDQILARFGMYPESSAILDISSPEGKALVAKYNITAVPAFILTKEASIYQQLIQVWYSVGTVESDGVLVFRNPRALGTYKDLATGSIVSGG